MTTKNGGTAKAGKALSRAVYRASPSSVRLENCTQANLRNNKIYVKTSTH